MPRDPTYPTPAPKDQAEHISKGLRYMCKMLSIKVPTFYGQPYKDIKQFIKFVKHVAKAEYKSKADQEETKLLILILNCKGDARSFVCDDLDDDTLEDWPKLKKAMMDRFLKEDKTDKKGKAFEQILLLKQKGKSLTEYFGEVCHIKRYLSKDQMDMLKRYTIKGLDNKTIRVNILANKDYKDKTAKKVFTRIQNAYKGVMGKDGTVGLKKPLQSKYAIQDLPPEYQFF